MPIRLKLSILAACLMTTLAMPCTIAYATDANTMVLVTPDGSILESMPEAGEAFIRKDRLGRRVLVDANGTTLATEMPYRQYRRVFGLSEIPDAPVAEANDPNYFPEAPVSEDAGLASVERSDLGDVTGAIPDMPDQQLDGGNGIDQQLPDAASPESDPTLDQGTPPVDAGMPATPSFPLIDLKGKSRLEITALQVFLDREGMSPGVIDGKAGSNVSKAVDAWQTMTGETLDYRNSEDILARLGYSGGLPIVEYTITSADAAGPYVAAIPEDYSQKAMLPAMSYTSVTEALAERFHMDENYLKELNPGADFTLPGTTIKVVNPGEVKKAQVARIVADKARKQIFAYDDVGGLVAAYPASIGSSDTPSPSGIHAVSRIALDPNYTYNPKINFQQGENTKVLTIQPGPNGPVGSVWIALDKPTYGIHGTPEPSKIGKSQSHGCIRLTNWDARELAKMLKPGVTVEFID